jgi:hypothetical protein
LLVFFTERGFLLPSVEDVNALARAYGTGARERKELVALAGGLRFDASARVILSRGIAEMQRRIGQLEAASTTIRRFQPAIVDSLLQTEAYMRLVFGIPGSSAASEEDVDAATRARLDRQRLIEDRSKHFLLITTEGALRWHAGSSSLMVEQIEATAATAQRPNLRVGIIPWTTPVTLFPLHGFHVYDDDAVIVGTLTATATMTGAADVTAYLEQLTAIKAAAAFGDQLQAHLARIADDYRQLQQS